jgi:hypothetical protein
MTMVRSDIPKQRDPSIVRSRCRPRQRVGLNPVEAGLGERVDFAKRLPQSHMAHIVAFRQ